ncbi:hypothetical protein Pelo_10847 [Pelomyxa schiedti]|nr:hypothetical protein Pelo_10847 [Pelomyxa schiedti]
MAGDPIWLEALYAILWAIGGAVVVFSFFGWRAGLSLPVMKFKREPLLHSISTMLHHHYFATELQMTMKRAVPTCMRNGGTPHP